MSKFRVAFSADFMRPDGSPTFPAFDLSPLNDDPNIEVVYASAADGAIKAQDMAGIDALILLVPKFTRESIPDDGRLAMVARFGVGYDNVDVEACSERGIATVITPDGVRRPVAVSIMTLMLALTGKLMAKDKLTREGRWAEKSDTMGIGLVGRTLGSVGIGNIGAELFRLAKPFDMNFIAHDPYVDPAVAQSLGVRMVELDEVFANADIVNISCPLTEETRHLVGSEKLALMKPTAYLINTARGPVVDQKALIKVLREGRIAGAGLDVFEEEPVDPNEPLLKLDNVIVTPHALCWTDECFAGIGAADVKAVMDIMHGRPPVGIVNRAITSDPAWLDKLKQYKTRFGD